MALLIAALLLTREVQGSNPGHSSQSRHNPAVARERAGVRSNSLAVHKPAVGEDAKDLTVVE